MLTNLEDSSVADFEYSIVLCSLFPHVGILLTIFVVVRIAHIVSSRSVTAQRRLRSIAYGWFLSSRMGERTALPCAFGCTAYERCEDDPRNRLEHYMRCNSLSKFIATVIDGAEYRESPRSVKKACFVEPALNDLKTICIAFEAYHAHMYNTVCVCWSQRKKL